MKTLLVIFSVFSLISVFCFFWDRALKANERERQYRAECEEHDKKMQAAAKKREKEEAQKAARAQRAAEAQQRLHALLLFHLLFFSAFLCHG